jgi:signal peptidase II
MKCRNYLMWLVPLIPFIGDRISKMFILSHVVIPHSPCYGLNILITWNRGVSWSMLHRAEFWWLIAGLSALILTLIAYTQWRMQRGVLVIGELLVIGGALSNLVDRLMYGAVLDFIELYVGDYHWPVFNVADVFIVIGVGIMLIRNWREHHDS